jgi:hypothetical protein
LKVSDLRQEIQMFGKSPYVERTYPLTSDWVPIADVLSVIDRFERQLRERLEFTQKNQASIPVDGDKEPLRKIVVDLLS